MKPLDILIRALSALVWKLESIRARGQCERDHRDAERRMGELLRETERANTVRDKKRAESQGVTPPPTLASLGITKNESSKAQKLSADHAEAERRMAALLRFLCVEALTPPRNPEQCLSGIGTRALAALWSLDPGTFTGTPSQARLAAGFGKSHGWLTRAASEFCREFGIVNGFGQHGRGGQHRQKLKVAFAPTVSFRVPISGAQEGPAPLVSSPEGVPTAPDDQNAPQGTAEALP